MRENVPVATRCIDRSGVLVCDSGCPFVFLMYLDVSLQRQPTEALLAARIQLPFKTALESVVVSGMQAIASPSCLLAQAIAVHATIFDELRL